jgi:Mrp family chromosome partitioning ATPase
MSTTTNEQYAAIRVTLESGLVTPYVLAIGGATNKDASGVIACNLAKSFADAGYRTVVIDPYGTDLFKKELGLRVAPCVGLATMAGAATNGSIKNLSAVVVGAAGSQTSISRLRMRAAFADLRNAYDLVIVDAGVLLGNPTALQFVSACDGVLLGFRFGRKPTESDRELTAALSGVGVKIVGVIAVGDPGERRPEPAYHAPLERVRVAGANSVQEPARTVSLGVPKEVIAG